MRYVLIGLTVIALLVMGGWTVALYADAVIDWWIVPSVALAVGVATGLHLWRMWRPLTGSQSMALNGLCHTVIATVTLTFLFFLVNDAFSDRSTEHVEQGVVTGHFREERHRTRRVGRRYVASDEKYYVYRLQITLPGIDPKFISVPYDRYKKVHDGDSVSVPVREGMLGVTLLGIDNLKFQTRPVVRKKSRLRYFGRGSH